MTPVENKHQPFPSPEDLGPFFSGVLQEMRKMSSEEIFQTLVASGIYTKSGELTKEYGGTAIAERVRR